MNEQYVEKVDSIQSIFNKNVIQKVEIEKILQQVIQTRFQLPFQGYVKYLVYKLKSIGASFKSIKIYNLFRMYIVA